MGDAPAAEPVSTGPTSQSPAGGWSFDLAKISRKEYSNFRLGRLSDDDDDALLARATGMSVDMIQALPHTEFRQLVRAFYKKATEPLADPNSASASSTP